MTTPSSMLASGMSEAEAIEGAKQGDGECFEFLYRLHKRRVYSLCFRMVGEVEAAEDFAQEAFLQLYRKIASFRGESAFATWLHRITVNIVLMHVRKRRVPEVSLEETLESDEDCGPKKDYGYEDRVLTGSIDRVNLERVIKTLHPAIASSSCCMTLKDTSTKTLPRCWAAPLAPASRSFTKRVCPYVNS